MAINNQQRGFALLIAVIFMTVMLAFGLMLGALGYKQSILASSAVQSQYAFYAADAGLECALYADQQENMFSYLEHDENAVPGPITCAGSQAQQVQYDYDDIDLNRLHMVQEIEFGSGATARCARVTIYKYENPINLTRLPDGTQPTASTLIFSEGTDAPCGTATSRTVARGLQIHY